MTYGRDFAARPLEMTGTLPQSLSAPVGAAVGTELNKRPQRRRARRGTETDSARTGGGFVLPGRSLAVGPAPSIQRAAPPAAATSGERDYQVSEALRVDLPVGDGVDYDQWLISKLPEIVEKCCREQPRVDGEPPPPVRRQIRINISANPTRTTPEQRQRDRSDDQNEETPDELALNAAGPPQMRHFPSSFRLRRGRRAARRGTYSSATSLESARRTAEGDAATAELVRRVLEEMFGPKSGDAGTKHAEIHRRGRSTSCQTSPRLVSGIKCDGGGSRTNLGDSNKAEGSRELECEGGDVTEVAVQTDPSSPSPRLLSPSPPEVAVKSPSPSPRPRDTSQRILDTLTESNRLLRQMSEFFRRAELNERVITKKSEPDDPAGLQKEPAELPIIQAEREGRITQRQKTGRIDDGWRFLDAPTANVGDVEACGGSGRGGGTARSEGFSRGDGPSPEAFRHHSDSELNARVRRYATAADHGISARNCERHRGQDEDYCSQDIPQSPLPVVSPKPYTCGDSAPSTGRSWTSPQLLTLHSEERPYRPLVSPPPTLREADTYRSETGEGPRASSPVETDPPVGQICSHRQTAAGIDSTDVLLDYDPWQAIENDFKTLLN